LKAIKEKQASHLNLGVKSEYLKSLLDFSKMKLYDKLLSVAEPSFNLNDDDCNSLLKASEIILLSDKNTKEEALLLMLVCIFKIIISEELKNEKHNINYGRIVSKLISLISVTENLTLGLKSLIKKINYSYQHVNRVFLQEVGISLSTYFRQEKINYAKKLLSSTNYTLETIAKKLGYSSAYALSSTFKKTVGESPAQYSKTHKSEYDLQDVD
jgi:AraC-like DNA-binding protein